MKTPTGVAGRLLPLAMAALLLVGPLVAPPAQEDMSLHDVMENLKAQLKGLAGALEESRQDAALDHLSMMQSLILLGKEHEPSNLYDMPEEQRDAHALDFRADMARTLAALAEIEIQVCAADYEGALGAVRNKLLTLRNESHDKYQVEDH